MLPPVSWGWNQHLLRVKTKKYGDKEEKGIQMMHQVKNTIFWATFNLCHTKKSLFAAQSSSTSGMFKPGQFSLTKNFVMSQHLSKFPLLTTFTQILVFMGVFLVIKWWNSALAFLSWYEELSSPSLLFPTLQVSQFDSFLRSCLDPAWPGTPASRTHCPTRFCHDCTALSEIRLLKIFYCFLKTSINKLKGDIGSRPAKLLNTLNSPEFSLQEESQLCEAKLRRPHFARIRGGWAPPTAPLLSSNSSTASGEINDQWIGFS